MPNKSKNILAGRAKSKAITNSLVQKLAALESPLKKSYWNTFHCCEHLAQNGQTLTAKYCNNRWCATCNRIRTAKLIDGYNPALKKLKNKYFVTLTIPNVKELELPGSIDLMLYNFNLIKDKLRKRGIKLIGIRKLECTYNSEKNNFHPHFHLIISGRFEADKLLNEWLKKYPDARKIAQDIRPANEKSVKELFKYFTKLVSKGTKGKTHIFALDIIFQSMRGRRVFQPLGIRKYVSEDIQEIQGQLFEDLREFDSNGNKTFTVWEWHVDFYDWIDTNTGEFLTGYMPDKKTISIINGFD